LTIVIDIGCARYGNDYSIERLFDEFHPDVLYGFDPNDAIREFEATEEMRTGETAIILAQQAAWTYDGSIGYRSEGLNSVLTHHGPQQVQCFDLAAFIRSLPETHGFAGDERRIILKIDAEGSEYELLEHLMHHGADELLKLAWVEWHPFGVADPAERRASIERRIRCELAEWLW
jgi:hypothetical protein